LLLLLAHSYPPRTNKQKVISSSHLPEAAAFAWLVKELEQQPSYKTRWSSSASSTETDRTAWLKQLQRWKQNNKKKKPATEEDYDV
jgi:hypothetical protein